MEHTTLTLEGQANRHQLAERIARSSAPTIPSSPRRHALAQRLRRFADRIDT